MFCHLLRHLCQTARMKLQRVNQPRESPPCSQGEDTPIVRNRELLLEGEIVIRFQVLPRERPVRMNDDNQSSLKSMFKPCRVLTFSLSPSRTAGMVFQALADDGEGNGRTVISYKPASAGYTTIQNNTENLWQQKHDITTET